MWHPSHAVNSALMSSQAHPSRKEPPELTTISSPSVRKAAIRYIAIDMRLRCRAKAGYVELLRREHWASWRVFRGALEPSLASAMIQSSHQCLITFSLYLQVLHPLSRRHGSGNLKRIINRPSFGQQGTMRRNLWRALGSKYVKYTYARKRWAGACSALFCPYRCLININLENERLLFSISDGLDFDSWLYYHIHSEPNYRTRGPLPPQHKVNES